ncbi:DNAH [Acanthosepion pharaonis]|uniref:DNAH n=1 Tax=Acanthosepion pharaonis TaxID=158019 RepID=A0A812CHI3_ACAPH|nr:DNAH [Sepia pharaonis]
MELLIPNGFPILLCGPHGSGKTALINDIMNIFGQQEFVYKRLVYSESTTAKQLLNFIQANIYHRQGFVHGAIAKKKLGLFIEDISLPKSDDFGVQRCNELLRQVVGEKIIYNLKRPFEIKCIEGLSVMAELTMSGINLENCHPRLLRHFSIFNLPLPNENDLVAIISKKLECVFNLEEQPAIDGVLFDGIVDASCQLLLRVQAILSQSPLPGRQHYIFTLHNIQHCFQSELHAVNNLNLLHDCLQGYMTRYNAAKVFNNLDIFLSEYTISHIIRIHRILSYQRGHLLTISSLGSGIEKLCILACEVANVSIVRMENLQGSDFIDGLKDAIRQAGTTANTIAILLDAKTLQNPIHLDCINSFLVTEDYTSFFSNEELPTILQALVPEGKKDQEKKVEPAVLFSFQINHNLHILINFTPTDNLLSTALSRYPSLLKVCQINWMCDWLKNNLLSTATYFLKKSDILKEPELRCEISSCLADIHHLMLRKYKSIPWAGDMSATICLHTVKHLEKKKDKIKICKETVTNLPYTQSILMEHIQMQQESAAILGKSHITLSMQEYEQLLHCFHYLFSKKIKQKEEKIVKIKKSLVKLDETRKMLSEMKETVKDITLEYEEAKSKAGSLLSVITKKATKLQTLKAKIGINSAIQAILEINEINSNFDENYTEDDNLLKIDDYDEFDREFDRIREENVIQSKKKVEENLASARKMYSLKKKCVKKSREQVYFWRHKIDRNCIESIKGFVKPPSLVLHIADMMMILTGRHNPLSGLNVSANDVLSIRDTPVSSADSISSQKGQSKRRTDLSWKTIQQILSESKDFTALLHNLPLEEGLNPLMMKTLSTCISSKDIERSRNEIENKIQDVTNQSISKATEEGISIAAAKHASEDAAILLQYMLALLVYSMFFKELKEIKETIQALQEQVEKNGKQRKEKENETASILEDATDEELQEEDLPIVEQELESLQREYSCAVEKKATLEGNLHNKNEKLRATSQLLTSLKKKELEWQSYVQEESNEVLVTNSLLASAFMTYCGPFHIKHRQTLCDSFLQICKEHHFPEPYHKLFKNLDLHQYIFPPMLQMDLEIRQMPMTKVFLENFCFFVEEKSWTKWPLICDPNHQAIGWCRTYLQGTNFVEVNLHELKSHLDSCLTEGIPLLLTECDPLRLSNNQHLCSIIGASKIFLQATESFKMNVGDHEVECKPSFRLYLHTSSEAFEVGDFLAAFTKRLTFPQSVDCLTIQLLLRCQNQEKNRVKEERSHLLQIKEKQSKFLEKAETELITEFCKDIFIMKEMPTLKNLLELVKKYEDLQESLKAVDKDLEIILQQTKDQYILIAKQGALCYNIMQNMKELNPLYQFPYPRFLKMFDSIVSQSDRSLAKSVAEKLLFTSNQKMVQRLLSKDRIVFTLLLAMEIEFNGGRIQAGEREFLISPTSALQTLPSVANASNLLTKNSLRSDRVIQLTTAFIMTVLGNKFVSDSLLNIPLIMDQSSPTTPILMLAFNPSINAELYFSNCSKGKGNFETVSLNVSIYSSMVEAKIKKFIWQKMSEGIWLLLNNAHSWPDLLVNILSWLKEKKIVNPMFRCWLSIDVNSCQIPSHLLNNSLRLVMDSPIHVKENMLQSFSHLDPDILKRSSNPMWPAMIHNICLLHATLRLRASLKSTWSYPEDIWKNDSSELLEAIEFAATEFKDSVTFTVSGGGQTTRIVSWYAIRNILSEGIFGRCLQHLGDRLCLAAMVEHLISLSAVKKDFEYSKLKYKIPAAFFQNNFLSQKELPYQKDIAISSQSKTIQNDVSSCCLSNMLPSCTDIWEVCVESLSKLPRILSKENLQSRMNKVGGATVYNKFIFGEIAQLNNVIQEIKSTLQVLKSVFEGQHLGDNLPEKLVQVAKAIFSQEIPQLWMKMLGPTSLISSTNLANWLQDLHNRSTYLEKITLMGREKMPTYWIGAFINPQKFLSLFKWEFMMKMANENVTYENISTQTIITGRDKDHIRDPPAEGVFLYGIYTWGFIWDKATGEVLDSLPKGGGGGSLPVVHLFYTHEPKDNLYPCPVYSCRDTKNTECIFELDIYKENVTLTRWSLRGIMATLHPF